MLRRPISFTAIIFLWSLAMNGVSAQVAEFDTIDNILVLNKYEEAGGYYAYYQEDHIDDKRSLVVFLHGYGALNPMIFGSWIAHLTSLGHCVLYPRYQESMFNPGPSEFVPNTVSAIRHFIDITVSLDLQVDTTEMAMIGHSYGGVIAANLAAKYPAYGCPKPSVALICEPGTGPFSGAVLESYAEIDHSIVMAVVVGENDGTVGQEFGIRIYEEAVSTPNRVLFWQYPDNHGEEQISASHYEPYAIDSRFDNGMSNFTSNKALRVASFDQVDTAGYWRIFDTLMDRYQQGEPLLMRDLAERLCALGYWDDGTPVRNLEYRLPLAGDE